MRLKISLAASLALAALLAAACGPQDSSAPAPRGGTPATGGTASNQTAANSNGAPAAPAADHADGVRRITIQEARAELDAGRAVMFDVRSKESYEMGHIKGARVVPYDQVEQHLAEFPKDKLIITYCA